MKCHGFSSSDPSGVLNPETNPGPFRTGKCNFCGRCGRILSLRLNALYWAWKAVRKGGLRSLRTVLFGERAA